MSTLSQLIERTKQRLGSGDTSASSLLQNAVDATDLTFQLDTTTGFSRGVAEIGLELVRVAECDVAARTLRIPPYGRGYMASTAQAHPAGAEVLFNPAWKSRVVADELNSVIRSLYPDLYEVAVHETTVPSDRFLPIDLPAGTIGVISVWLGDPVRPGSWVQENRWAFNPDSTDSDTPLRIGGHPKPGWTVRVVYAKAPGTFDLSDPGVLDADFTTVTGLPERLEDLLALGVAARLTPFIEVARLPATSAEARADAQSKPAGQAATIARVLAAEFRARVEQEVRVLHKEHPIKVHRAG